MKQIVITTQAEYEALEETIEAEIIIDGQPQEKFKLYRELKHVVISVSGNATVQYVSDNATVQYVSGNATVQYVSDNATVQYVRGNATVQYVSDNAIILVYSKISFTRITQQSTIILCDDGEIDAEYISESVAVVKRTTKIQNSLDTMKEVFGLTENDSGKLTMFKARDPKTKCDYHTGKIKYEGEVVCPDWDPNPDRKCGGGLHISPLPGLTRIWAPDGEVVEVKVKPEDIIIHADDITKCRARRVFVGEVVEEGRKA